MPDFVVGDRPGPAASERAPLTPERLLRAFRREAAMLATTHGSADG